MLKPFEFDAEGRTYSCTVEERRGSKGEFWWWFGVSGDAQTYGAFEAKKTDTRESVQERVLAFYNTRLYALAQPARRGSHWGTRKETPKPQQTAEQAPEVTS